MKTGSRKVSMCYNLGSFSCRFDLEIVGVRSAILRNSPNLDCFELFSHEVRTTNSFVGDGPSRNTGV